MPFIPQVCMTVPHACNKVDFRTASGIGTLLEKVVAPIGVYAIAPRATTGKVFTGIQMLRLGKNLVDCYTSIARGEEIKDAIVCLPISDTPITDKIWKQIKPAEHSQHPTSTSSSSAICTPALLENDSFNWSHIPSYKVASANQTEATRSNSQKPSFNKPLPQKASASNSSQTPFTEAIISAPASSSPRSSIIESPTSAARSSQKQKREGTPLFPHTITSYNQTQPSSQKSRLFPTRQKHSIGRNPRMRNTGR